MTDTAKLIAQAERAVAEDESVSPEVYEIATDALRALAAALEAAEADRDEWESSARAWEASAKERIERAEAAEAERDEAMHWRDIFEGQDKQGARDLHEALDMVDDERAENRRLREAAKELLADDNMPNHWDADEASGAPACACSYCVKHRALRAALAGSGE